MSYSNITDVKAYIGIAANETADDGLLEDLGEGAQAIIERETGKVFEATADSTRYFDAVEDVCERTLTFDKPVASITTVVNGDGATIASSAYVTEPRNISPKYAITLKLSSNAYWTYSTDPENAIAVTGRWAYSVMPPADIKHWHIRLTAWLYKQNENYNPANDRPIVSPDGVLLLPMTLPRDIVAGLRPYVERL